MTGTVGLLTTAAGRSGRFSPGGREGRRRPAGGADPGRSSASRPRSETGLGPVAGDRVGIGAWVIVPASASGVGHRPIRSRRSVRNPQHPASPGDRSGRSACRRARRRLRRQACEGRTGRAGRRERAMGCAVARRFPHRRTDIGVPDTLPCASPARGVPVGRRRDTAGPGRVPKGPIPAGQSARSRRFRKSPPYRALRSDRIGVEASDRSPRRGERPASETIGLIIRWGNPPVNCRSMAVEEERGERAKPGDRPMSAGGGYSFSHGLRWNEGLLKD